MTRGFLGSRGFSSSSSALRFFDAVEVVVAVVFVLRAVSVVPFFAVVLVVTSVDIFFGRPRPALVGFAAVLTVLVLVSAALGASAVLFAAAVFAALAAGFLVAAVAFLGGIFAVECGIEEKKEREGVGKEEEEENVEGQKRRVKALIKGGKKSE